MSSRVATRGWALALLALLPLGAQAADCRLEAKIQPDDQVVNEGADVVLNAEPSQPKDATFVWTQLSGPAVTLNLSKPSKPTFIAPQVTSDQQAVFRLTVLGCGASATVTTRIDIRDLKPPANSAPTAVATASPELAAEGINVTLSSAGSTDAETPAQLAYQWTQVTNGNPTVTLSGANTPTATFTAPQVTGSGVTLEFNLRVTDPSGLFHDDTAVVNVVFSNDSPFAALSCPMHVDEGATVTLDGSASSDFEDDALGKALIYTWSQTVGPPYVSVSGQTTESISFTAPSLTYGQTGGMYFGLKVTDSAGAYSLATCGVIVDDATAPVFAGDDDRIVEATSPSGATVHYGITATDNVEGDVSPSIACTPPAGSAFALDAPTQVACSVTDTAGNLAQTSFEVVVRDRTKPVIAAHGDIAVEATGPQGATVDYALPDVVDLVDLDVVATCSPPPGMFSVASHSVTCNAKDFSGNAADPTTFTVTVHDLTPPVVTVPGPITREATSAAGAAVEFEATAFDIVDEAIAPTCKVDGVVVASGDTFALGTSQVVCEATDTAGNKGSNAFTITVVDTTPPVVDDVADRLGVEATGPNGAPVTFANPQWTDAVSGTGTATCVPASGSSFALGTTTVTCSATDGANNTGTSSFTIEVVDTTAPSMTLPADITREATGPSGASVTFVASANDIVDGTVAVSCTPASGSTFGLGTTAVNCSASDTRGNTAHGSFHVTVEDTTPPTIAPHADVTATATGDSKAVVHYTNPTATDLVDGPVGVSCTPASGTIFPVGSTVVNCSATDSAGNTNASSFNVIVSYAFAGFFAPVDNLPVVNTVQAGQSIPVKFSLGGDQGMAIFAAGYPKSTVMTCNGGTQDLLEETSTAGSSSLAYDPGTGRYHYVWKTEKAWSGTCRQLQLKFADGKVQVANFYFRK